MKQPRDERSAAPSTPFDLGAWLAGLSDYPPIVQAGARVLRHRAENVPSSLLATPELRNLTRLMTEVMHNAPGVGLAAPQIGVPLRVFVAEDLEERIADLPEGTATLRGRVALPLTVLVNPKLTPEGDERVTFFEGCLSVRGYGALVPRWRAVRISGVDAEGRPVSLRLEGWPARIMQHELDHLDGTLYIDRMLSRSFATDSELPRLSGMGVDEAKRELGIPSDATPSERIPGEPGAGE
ncbi:MAG TPA: peptide deformylase [Polyangiaceae bacterium]|nr:peptide deformylase [Polyangiaceae bacterium]